MDKTRDETKARALDRLEKALDQFEYVTIQRVDETGAGRAGVKVFFYCDEEEEGFVGPDIQTAIDKGLEALHRRACARVAVLSELLPGRDGD